MTRLSVCIGRLLAFGGALTLVGCGAPREALQRPQAGAPATALAPAPGKAPKQTFGKPVPLPKNKPLIYKDADSGILFYVESDRRHVAAIDKNGKVLWCKDPFLDAGLKPVWQENPFIFTIAKPLLWIENYMKDKGKFRKYISIGFSSSQFGVIDEQTGVFTYLGHD